MAYANENEARAAMMRAFEVFKEQYQTGTNRFGRPTYRPVPWSAKKAFNDKWFPIIQHAGSKQPPHPASRYNLELTPEQKQAYHNRVDSAAAKAYANPSFPDPAPPTPQPSPVDEVAATYESKIKELQDMITQQASGFEAQQQQMQEGLAAQQQQMQADLAAQQQNFAAQQRQMQESLAAQQKAYNKQAQQMANSQRAYTPAPEATATETTTPDSGIGIRRNARSSLSSLAIIEGLGTNANPLSGLQLA